MVRRIRPSLVLALIAASLLMMVLSLLIGTESLSIRQAWHEWRSGLSPEQAPVLGILLGHILVINTISVSSSLDGLRWTLEIRVQAH